MSGLKFLYNLILKDAARGSGQASGILSIGSDVRKIAMNKYAKFVDSAKRQGVDLDSLSEQEIKYMLEMNRPKGPTIGGHQIIDASSSEGQGITRNLFNMLDRQSGKNVIKADFGKPFAEEIVTVERVITDIKKMKPMDSMKEANKVLKGEGRYKSLSKADREKIAGDESVTDHIFERNIEPDPEDFAYGGIAGMLGERPGYQLGKIVYDPLINQKTQLPPSQGLGIGKVPSRINREYTDATSQAFNIGNIAATTGVTSPTALVNLSQNPRAANMMRSMNLMQTDSPKTKTGFEEQGLSSDYRHALGTSALKDSVIDYLGSNLGIDKSSGILDAMGSAVAKGATVFEEGKDALSQIKAYNTQYPGEYKVDGLADYDFIPSKPTLSFEEILAQPKEDFTANFFAADQIPFGTSPVTKMEMIDSYRKFGPKLFMKQLQNKKKQDFQNIVKAAEQKKAADAAEKARLERLGKDKNRGGFDPSGPTQKSIRRDRADKSGKGHSGGFTNPGKGSYGPHMASGGIAGMVGERPGYGGGYLVGGAKSLGKKYKGSTLQAILENPKLLGAELGHDGLMELFNLLPGLFADGGRAGFAEGKGPKMSRRNFLKGLGALAALPVVGKFFKFVKPLAKTSKVADLTQVPIGSAKGMPTWFKPLVNKVIKEGEEVLSEGDRIITHKARLPGSKTDVYVTQDLTNGEVVADIGMGKHGWADGHLGQPARLEYKPGEIIEPVIEGKYKGKVGKKTQEEFNVEEAEFTGGHPENIKFEESTINKFGEHGSNFDEVEMFATGKIKKASGGIARMLGE